jgi:hypothetical protein
MGQFDFFDADKRLAVISAKGDLLEMIDRVVPFESFRGEIEAATLTPASERKSNAGRKRIDVIVMFRMLVLQSLYNLSDEQVEYQVRDRLSFTRFLRLGIEDSIPDGTSLRRAAGPYIGSKATVWRCPRYFRFAPESRHSSQGAACLKSATNGLMHRSKLPLYSITTSARARSVGGISRPSAFAVLRLMMRTNLTGCATGRSAGVAPLRILSTYAAAPRARSGIDGP